MLRGRPRVMDPDDLYAKPTITSTDLEFERDVAALPLERPVPSAVVRTLSLLLEVLLNDKFNNNPYEVNAMGHVLLTAQGIASAPCLGEVGFEHCPYEHAWLEIDGAIYDLAIDVRPRHLEFLLPSAPMVIAGLHLDGEPHGLLYGIDPDSYGGGLTPHALRSFAEPRTLPEYFDFQKGLYLSLWETLELLSEYLDLSLDEATIRKAHADTRWTVRADKQVPKALAKHWRWTAGFREGA